MNFNKPKVLLLSIKPHFVQKILDGEKRVELRKARPRLNPGDYILIYESAPAKILRGWFEIQNIVCEKPSLLWPKVKKDSGLTKREFDLYYENSSFGVGIFIKDKRTTALPLHEVRQKWSNFRPPQSFHYLKDDEVCLAEEITKYNLSSTNQSMPQLVLTY
jgi:predicted transcriptional regulator